MAAYPNHVKFDKSEPKRILNFNQVFKIINVIGKGGVGTVYKIVDIKNNKPYALKMLNNFDRTIFKEIGMLKKLSTIDSIKDSVVKYYNYFIYNNKLCILMEYIDGNTANNFFKTHNFGLKDYINFCIWLTNIIKNLHLLGYVHRDIKPDNIMVTKNRKFILIDFGFSCRVNYPKDPLKCPISSPGTPVFVAPELWNGTFKKNINKYYLTIDVYAMGVTLYEILTRSFPYKLNSNGQVISNQYNYVTIKFVSNNMSNLLNDILYGMVILNANNRLTASEAYIYFVKYNKLL